MSLGKDEAKAMIDALERQFQFWGDELHDGLCQTLAGAGMLVQNIARAAEGGFTVPKERIDALQASIEEAIDQLRRLSTELTPLEMQGTTLMMMLNDLAEKHSGNCKCTFVCEKPVVVRNAGVALALYRVAQEFCRMGSAHSKVVMTLHEARGEVSLLIETNADADRCNDKLVEARMLAAGGTWSRKTDGDRHVCTFRVPQGRTLGASNL